MTEKQELLRSLAQTAGILEVKTSAELVEKIEQKIISVLEGVERAPTDALKEKFFAVIEKLTLHQDDLLEAFNAGQFAQWVSQAEAESSQVEQDKRQAAEDAARAKAEAERKATEEAARKKAEAERKAAEETARKKAEAERKAAEETARKKVEAERKAAEEAARKKAEAERKAAEEAARKKTEAERKAKETSPQTLEPDAETSQAAEVETGDQPSGSEKLLAGRFQIEALLGEGGMGVVYQAMDKQRDERVAVKLMHKQLMDTPQAKERFLNEAKISSQLSHPSIVNVFDAHQHGGSYVISMELLEGQSLRTYLDNLKLSGQIEAVDHAVDIITRVAEALVYAHEFTVHRDIKPENIWMCENGDVKLMDFGVARLLKGTKLTRTGTAMGSVCYMSPEQLRGQADISAASDQYSLAAVLYEMLAGEVPVGRFEPLAALRKDIPKALSSELERAMTVNIDERFSSIAAFSQAINESHTNTANSFASPANIKWLAVACTVLVTAGFGYTLLGEKEDVKRELPVAEAVAEAVPSAPVAVPIPANKIRTAAQVQMAWNSLIEGKAIQSEAADIFAAELVTLEQKAQAGEVEALANHYGTVAQGYEALIAQLERALKQQELAQTAKSKLPSSWLAKSASEPNKLWSDAVSALQSGSFDNANQLFKQAESAYQTSLSKYQVVKQRAELAVIKQRASKTRAQWQAVKSQALLPANAAAKAENAWEQGVKTQSLANAISHYREAEKSYAKLLTDVQAEIQKLAPNMMVIPAGSFQMGDRSGDIVKSLGGATSEVTDTVLGEKAGAFTKGLFEGTRGLFNRSLPVHEVTVPGFEIAAQEVTLSQYNRFAREMFRKVLMVSGKQEGDMPALNVTWEDAVAYTQWLSQKTGLAFRLPTEAEWEYAARAGTDTIYHWGNSIDCDKANFTSINCVRGDEVIKPVGSFLANNWKLFDMHGNAAEWTQDCWHQSYKNAPTDGSAWVDPGCTKRVLRGGGWSDKASAIRAADRKGAEPTKRLLQTGFRIVRGLSLENKITAK
jgi:formylglycine-generating enzyme required for sulfatase activity/tRNA A-37 threonylcarbamoyl transferase component Bud32